MKGMFGLFLVLLLAGLAFCQPDIEWTRCYRGSDLDVAWSVRQTSDGCYVVAGWTSSSDGDVSGGYGGEDIWIVKLNQLGRIVWQKSHGGWWNERAYCIQETHDSNYVVAGLAGAASGEVFGSHGRGDAWITKLNSSGDLIWQKCLGGSQHEAATCIQETNDSGYIMVGYSKSADGDVTENKGGEDYWIVKLDSLANIEWQKSFGGSRDDVAWDIKKTFDDGYIVTGYSYSEDGDIVGHHNSNLEEFPDYWVLKLGSDGDIIWQRSLGGSATDRSYSVLHAIDGYIIAGYSYSNDGDVYGNHSEGRSDAWIVKLDFSGYTIWAKAIGNCNSELVFSAAKTGDNGYVFSGIGLEDSFPDTDFLAIKMDYSGELLWTKYIDAGPHVNTETARDICLTTDGGYIIAGYNYSISPSGFDGYWVVKLAPDTISAVQEPRPAPTIFALSASPNPFNSTCQIVRPENTIVKIYDIHGQMVGTLSNEQNLWMPSKNLGSGLYFATAFDLSENKKSDTQKIVYLK